VNEAQATKESYERQGERWQDDRYRSWRPGNVFVLQEFERVLLAMLEQRGMLPLDEREILEIGCGSGKQLIRFLARGARPQRLHGIDLQDDLVDGARALAPHVDFRVGDATALPYADGAFDIVCALTMLSSMRSPESRALAAREMLRVVRPDGAIVVYDFWLNPRNPDVQAVGAREIARIFAGARIHGRRVTLAPPIVRAVAPRSWLACTALAAIPPLRTHRLSLITPRD
jgi:SAM-dependent methyltransferase